MNFKYENYHFDGLPGKFINCRTRIVGRRKLKNSNTN